MRPAIEILSDKNLRLDNKVTSVKGEALCLVAQTNSYTEYNVMRNNIGGVLLHGGVNTSVCRRTNRLKKDEIM